MVNNIKHRQLLAFTFAAELGSFVRAAERLCVSQPAFSSLIRELENELLVKLFERTTRSLELTAAGKEFLIRIQRPMVDLEEAYDHMHDLATVRRGILVLGALPSVAMALIPRTLRVLQQTHPSLQIRVVEAHNEDILSMLRTNEVEMSLGTLLTPVPDITFHDVIEDRFVVVYSSLYHSALPDPMTWHELVSHDLILTSKGSTPRAQYERAVADVSVRTASHYDVTHMTTAVEMVRQVLGIAVLPRLALPALRIDDLLYRDLKDDYSERPIGVLHRSDRNPSPAGEVFISALRTTAAEFRSRHGK